MKRQKKLKSEGINAKVVDVHTIKPLDSKGIVEILKTTKVAITVEDHNVIGALGSAICEIASMQVPSRIKRLGIQDIYTESGNPDELLDKYGMSIEAITNAAKELVKIK